MDESPEHIEALDLPIEDLPWVVTMSVAYDEFERRAAAAVGNLAVVRSA